MTKSVLLVSGCQWENKQNLKNSKQSKEKELFYSEENPLKADSYLYTSDAHRKIWAWHLALWRGSRQRRLLVLAGEQAFSPPRHQLQGLQAVLHYAEVLFSLPWFRSCNHDFTKCFSCVAFSHPGGGVGGRKEPCAGQESCLLHYIPTLSCTDIYGRVFLLWLVDVSDYVDFDWTALHNCNNSRWVMLEKSFMYRCIWTILYTCPNIERK